MDASLCGAIVEIPPLWYWKSNPQFPNLLSVETIRNSGKEKY